MRFYERCLPPKLPLRPWPPFLPRVKPAGHWDWFVFDNQADALLVVDARRRHVLDSLDRCGLRASRPPRPSSTFAARRRRRRHSSVPLSVVLRLSRGRATLPRRFKGAQLKPLHLLTCVADDVQKSTQAATCTAYLDDASLLSDQARCKLTCECTACAHSQFEDFAIM